MNKQIITMPAGVRYMSEASDVLMTQLPTGGKYILDKSLTGCGGTELFLNSSIPLVLISPRTGVLINKYAQHPEAHLFRDDKKDNLGLLKERLRTYLDQTGPNPFGLVKTPKILVTIDSAKHVIEELRYRNIIDRFLFLVDEFQCLIGDAAYKGSVDLEFLRMIDNEAKNICYMSATPIEDTYLGVLQEFQNLTYYKLEWDPAVIVEPTVKEMMMMKGESACTIMRRVIAEYRAKGCFASKTCYGTEVRSTEVVVFVNEVKTIQKIIKDNTLQPHETTILISSSSKYVPEFEKAGFEIDNQCTDRTNPGNRTFTFCSKASFEGRDFYSTNAFTYIFLDGTKDWQTHDTAIEIPQMLGRQRLDENPFKYNAIIYYRTKPTVESEEEFQKRIESKLKASESIINAYNNGDDYTKNSLVGLISEKDPKRQYESNYLDVIRTADGKYSIETNLLVAASEHNLWANKRYYYSNPLLLSTAIQRGVSACNGKPSELRQFESDFNNSVTFRERMGLYCSFLTTYPAYAEVLLSNPFIERKYHEYYHELGPGYLQSLSYDESRIRDEYQHGSVKGCCVSVFEKGHIYNAGEVKKALQEIYDRLGIDKSAKAKQLTDYIEADIIQITLPDGSRPRVYRIK